MFKIFVKAVSSLKFMSRLKPKISPFAQAVYHLTSLIPMGKVATYGQLAQALRQPGSARAVGQALHRNPFAPNVPCHRVIKSTGKLGGFASGLKKKIALLTQEGVIIKNHRIDLTKYQANL